MTECVLDCQVVTTDELNPGEEKYAKMQHYVSISEVFVTMLGECCLKGPVFQHEPRIPRIFNCWGRFMIEVTQRRGMFIPKVFLSDAVW